MALKSTFVGRAISSQLRHASTIGKKLVKQQYLPTCRHNMVNVGVLAAEIVSLVWGAPGVSVPSGLFSRGNATHTSLEN